MGILNRKPPDTLGPVNKAAASRVEAAERLSASLAQVGAAFEALFAADREFLGAYRKQYGAEAYSPSLLMNRFHGMLLADLELSAPELLRYLSQPRQSRAKAQTIATLIARQVENDLSSLPTEKEPAQ